MHRDQIDISPSQASDLIRSQFPWLRDEEIVAVPSAGTVNAIFRIVGDDLEWTRGAAWAFQQAMGVVWYYRATNPVMGDLGRSTIARLVESFGE